MRWGVALLLFEAFLIPSFTRADEMIFDLGFATLNTPPDTRFFAFAVQEDLWDPIKDRFTGGFWLDNSGSGHTSSQFMAAQIGIEIDNNGFIGSLFTGPSFMGSPDTILGSYLEFYHTLGFGIHDRNGNYVGAAYHHISNANISSINLGRDILGLELKFPF